MIAIPGTSSRDVSLEVVAGAAILLIISGERNGAQQRVLRLSGIQARVFDDNRYIGFEHARVVGARGIGAGSLRSLKRRCCVR